MRALPVRIDAVLIQALIAAALSFAHLHDLALAAGQDGWKAWAYPVSVDLLLVAAWRRLRSGGAKAAGWCWFLIALTASLGANVATAGLLDLDDVPDWLRILVAGWPAIAFLGGTLLAHGAPTDPPTGEREAAPGPMAPEPLPPHPSCPLRSRNRLRPPRPRSRRRSSRSRARSPTNTAPGPERPSTPQPFAPGSASRCRWPKPSPPT